MKAYIKVITRLSFIAILAFSSQQIQAQLTDCWGPSNWTTAAPNSTGSATVTTSTIVLVNDTDFAGSGLDFLDCDEDQGTETACIEIPETGTFTFDWFTAGAPFFYNPLIDRFGYCLNGVPTELNSTSPAPFGTSSGTHSISVTAGDNLCFIYSSKFSDTFADISVTISNFSTPGCPAACSSASAPTNPTSTLSAPDNVTLSWDVIPGSVACEVSGGPVGGPTSPLRIFAAEPSSAVVPGSVLVPGVTYEWSVRCACSVDLGPPVSVDATPASGTASFVWPSPRLGASLSAGLAPNPAEDFVQLTLEGSEASYQVAVFNGTGQTVYQRTVDANENVLIDVSDLPAGVYWVTSTGSTETSTQKLIVR